MSGSHDYEPKILNSLAGISIIEIACGEHHSLALDSNGDVYSWGSPTN
jgi:alpha-tubulin suppressor-like RCC1 family protein